MRLGRGGLRQRRLGAPIALHERKTMTSPCLTRMAALATTDHRIRLLAALSATAQAATQAPPGGRERPGLAAEQARVLARSRADGQHAFVDYQDVEYIDDKS
jgi:hypothetical protein